MRRLIIALIRVYQYLFSPLGPPTCRFTPNCSQYTSEAIEKYGATRGLWLGIKRIIRCNPWNSGGYDPVP